MRLGRRQSEDFHFFSKKGFEPSALIRSVGYLKQARIDQRGDNTLTVVAERDGPVRVSFFGNVWMNHVFEPDLALENSLRITSLLDLVATILKTIQQGAEAKDYRHIDAALGSGISLAERLAAAAAIYGKVFNPLATLKALSYFKGGNLPSLSGELQERLLRAVSAIKSPVTPKPGITRPRSIL